MKTKKLNAAMRGASFAQNQVIDNFSTLLPITEGYISNTNKPLVSSKNLHKVLGVGRDYSSWIRGRIEEYEFLHGVDYSLIDSPILGNQSTKNNHIDEAWKTQRGGDRKSVDYLITLNMAKELAMVERTVQGRAVRQYFIKCEEELQHQSPAKVNQLRKELTARIKAASYFKPMCTALELSRAEQGKQTAPHHYSNESNMITKLVLGGLTAKQWAIANELNGDPRNNMNTEQLDHLSYLEQSNITLIELGLDYPKRKAELQRLSQRHLSKLLAVSDD